MSWRWNISSFRWCRLNSFGFGVLRTGRLWASQPLRSTIAGCGWIVTIRSLPWCVCLASMYLVCANNEPLGVKHSLAMALVHCFHCGTSAVHSRRLLLLCARGDSLCLVMIQGCRTTVCSSQFSRVTPIQQRLRQPPPKVGYWIHCCLYGCDSPSILYWCKRKENTTFSTSLGPNLI